MLRILAFGGGRGEEAVKTQDLELNTLSLGAKFTTLSPEVRASLKKN